MHAKYSDTITLREKHARWMMEKDHGFLIQKTIWDRFHMYSVQGKNLTRCSLKYHAKAWRPSINNDSFMLKSDLAILIEGHKIKNDSCRNKTFDRWKYGTWTSGFYLCCNFYISYYIVYHEIIWEWIERLCSILIGW